ncbi:MAG: biopolymer transporter ExbD [Syntrophales bacterium]|nr:biopolymer transporter ExbD [Syntrophales bacterium]
MRFERRKRVPLHTNIAPLVDVVFILLLFFMVTSHISLEPSIDIKLPQSKTSQPHESNEIVLSISREGQAFIGEKKIEIDEICSAVRERLHSSNTKSIKIKADKDVSVGTLIQVVDEVRLSGAPGFSIVTEGM